MTVHHMRLYQSAFVCISSGVQKIELRLWDEKRRLVKVGDNIIFDCDGGLINAKVLGLSLAENFVALSKIISVPDTGWESADALIKGMEQYYSAALQRQYGVVGIHIRPAK